MTFLLLMIVGIVVVLTFMVCAIAAVIYLLSKNQRQFKKRSVEAEKIEKMLSSGKITVEEATELKKAVGIGAPAMEMKMEDKHIKILSILEVINAGLQIFVFGGIFFFIFMIAGLSMPLLSRTTVIDGNVQQSEYSNEMNNGQDESKTTLEKNQQEKLVEKAKASMEMKMVEKKRQNNMAVGTLAVSVLILLLLFLAFCLLRLIAALKLKKGSRAAKVIILVLSVLDMASFPLGTALGVYAFWVLLFRDGAEEYYEALSEANKPVDSLNP